MSVSRRRVLSAGLAFASVTALSRAAPALASPALASSALASPALVGLKNLNVRTLAFDCTNTGEYLDATDYWVEGAYVPDALELINEAMRDYRSDAVHSMSTRLLDLLSALGRRLDTDCRFEL